MLLRITTLIERLILLQEETPSIFFLVNIVGFELLREELRKKDLNLEKIESLLYGAIRSLEETSSINKEAEIGLEIKSITDQIYKEYMKKDK